MQRSALTKGSFDWALSGPIRNLRGDLQELILFPILRTFARLRIEGRDRLEGVTGPLVIVSNHSSHFDCPVILAALPHRIRHRTIVAAAADYFYRSAAFGTFTSVALGTIPFERHEGSRASLERCKEGIRSGWSVLLFPEGTRSKTGEVGEFGKGAAYLCIDTKCAVLPIFMEGLREVMPKGRWFPRRGKVIVRFGEMIAPGPADDYESFTRKLRSAVMSLG